MKFLFITGMFRSGTTLLAKMMDAHPQISFASDPYRPLFNDFRDLIAEKNNLLGKHPRQAPLGDYFFDDENLELMKKIQQADFNFPLPEERLERLIPVMADRAAPFSLFISKKMGKVRGRTYKELYESMMELVHECYGKKDAKVIGSKEVWCNEFTPVLLKTFPKMKIIHVIRDPRAVSASRKKLVEGENYPWLFLCRQWRKLAIFTRFFSNHEDYKNSLLVLKYEELVSNPQKASQRICQFLEVDFSEEMVNAQQFRDGDGSPWQANSSYQPEGTISTSFIEKWRQALTPEEIRYIELLCYPEMDLFGYEVIHNDVKDFSFQDVWDPMIVPESQLANWIRPFSDTRFLSNVNELMKEYFRRKLLTMSEEEISKIDRRIFEAMFIDLRYYTYIRNRSMIQI